MTMVARHEQPDEEGKRGGYGSSSHREQDDDTHEQWGEID
jgi:hypothetical protein